MNYAEIKYNDIANGPGVRTSLFVSGCTHRCPGCFNDIAWDFNYGKVFTKEVEEEIFSSMKSGYVAGMTVLGGEPFEIVNQKALLPFIREFKQRFPKKSLWCFSGYTYEELLDSENERCHCACTKELLELFDVLVDGRYVDALHDITLRFRGSRNQRLIDLRKTEEKGEIVIWSDEPLFAKHSL